MRASKPLPSLMEFFLKHNLYCISSKEFMIKRILWHTFREQTSCSGRLIKSQLICVIQLHFYREVLPYSYYSQNPFPCPCIGIYLKSWTFAESLDTEVEDELKLIQKADFRGRVSRVIILSGGTKLLKVKFFFLVYCISQDCADSFDRIASSKEKLCILLYMELKLARSYGRRTHFS